LAASVVLGEGAPYNEELPYNVIKHYAEEFSRPQTISTMEYSREKC